MDDWQVQKPATDDAETRRRHQANRAAWNEGAAAYTASVAETIAFLREGGSNVHPIERANLGDLRSWCKTAIHLQCASGKDTLSLLNEGVQRVVGVDISDAHIANAREITAALSAPAEWYRCDVLDTPHELDGTADLVYTGRGALNWLADIEGWAAVVARLLKPGRVVHVFDTHPFTYLLRDDMPTPEIDPRATYFEFALSSQGWPETYIGDLGKPQEAHAVKHERLWTLSMIVMALIRVGLTIEILGEYPDSYWDAFPTIPEEELRRVPQTFALMARKRP